MRLNFRTYRIPAKLIRCYYLLIGVLVVIDLQAQKNNNQARYFKKASLVMSSNAICNYFTNKTVVNMVNPDGWIPNSRQFVYYWQYKYYDTYTFDLGVSYNKFLTKHFSLSAGLRFDQLKRLQKTTLYVDSNSALPDIEKETRVGYSLSLPLSAHMYLKRFKFSLGLYAYVFSLTRVTRLYEYGLKEKFSSSNFGLQFLGQESVGFKLLKKRNIYAQLGLFHNFRFRNNYGYNKYFTLGLSFESFH